LVPIFEERFERFGIKLVPFFTLETLSHLNAKPSRWTGRIDG